VFVERCSPVSTSSTELDVQSHEDEFLYAMKEDLGEWLGALYGVHVGADEFFETLETGVLLCHYASAAQDRLRQTTQNDQSLISDNASKLLAD